MRTFNVLKQGIFNYQFLIKTMARPSSKSNSAQKGAPIVTPLMQQYYQAKAKYPDALLLFRVGDFYETFGEDAVTTSQVVGIVLTSRNNGGNDVELAGFPYHSLDVYLPKLVRAGYRVAICEQLEKPVAGRVVRRGVTEVITPGVTSDDKLLDQKSNNYLAVIATRKQDTGIALLDISTGELLVTEGDWSYLDKILQTFSPSEIVFSKSISKDFIERFGDKYYTYGLDEWVFQEGYGREKLIEHFQILSLKGFGIEDMDLAQSAAGAALHYLATTEKTNLKHINHISRLLPDKYVWLDRFTIRNLELISTNHETGKSLLDILDRTLSPMGARLMKKWIVLPLKSKTSVEQRLESVEYFIQNQGFKSEIESYIKQIGDLERLISKVPLGKINPREVRQLARSLSTIEPIQLILRGSNEQLKRMADTLNPCKIMREDIEKTLFDEPPVNLTKGGAIADGADADLDELRNIIKNAQSLLIDIQQREIEKTGITSLKIGFNNVFGYFLEVTAKYKYIEIPKEWIRKQTLANAERYITPELKVLEEKILGAEEKILAIEERLFQKLVGSLLDFIQPIQQNANTIAILDCLNAFSTISMRNNYSKPTLTEGYELDIKEGRHPVIEQQLPLGESYVPNDVYLDSDEQQILMITGPNMAGKSALLRQTALICLMAQMGCFVPAKEANIGLLDKVFTRVGASDNISSGESTFMVEMNETASIMNNISDRSLILLDEIGRGTSTYDGISIAWSIAEYLHESGTRPKTLFATHYHELNELADLFSRIKNYHVATKEVGQKVIFLRKLTEGGSEHSFGVHVARMAGMPNEIVNRANEILAQLEDKHIDSASNMPKNDKKETKDKLKSAAEKPMQLNFFDIGDPRLQRIKEALDKMDLNTMTPIDLMMKVAEWKKMLDN
jgi:DNA mismatch repair protein MutS